MTMSSDKPSSADIQREIETDRRRIEERIDAIQEKMSPGQLIDEVLDYVKTSGGGEYAANLGNAVKANPIPLALISVSMAWLMAGTGKQSRSSHHDGDRYPLATISGEIRRTGPAQEQDGKSYSHFADSDGNRFKALTDKAGRRAGHFIDERGKTYRGFADAAGNRVLNIKDEVGTMLDDASGWISDTWQQVSDNAVGLSEQVAGHARRVGDASSSAGTAFGNQATRLNDTLLAHFKDQPLVGGSLAFAVGAAIGAALPHTELEDSMAGEAAESVKESMSETAEEMLDRGKEAASEVLDRAANVADKAYDAASESIKDRES